MSEQKIGIYLRLSKDDEREGESMSIENQRKFLTQYLHNRGWQEEESYIDDGWSGTNFDRPGFQRLLTDIEGGRINTVVTKDLSRLGRDQIGTAYYYQIYFPRRQVRYIAVTEGFDTAETGAANALFPFLTAANDFYTADISRKVRTALTARKRDGKFIGSSAPLGYQKDSGEPGRLVIEPEGAEIVRFIFRTYLSCGSVIGVAKQLTEQGVPTPSQLKKRGAYQARFPGTWSDTMVRRILTNPTYAGHLTQNRNQKVNYKLKQRVSLPREQWMVCPNTHEAVISQAEFDQAQEMLEVRSYFGRAMTGGHILTGLACCADCGSPMTYVRESDTRTYMVCQGYRKGGRLHLCTSHCIREDRVLEAIRQQLRQLTQAADRQALREAAERTGPGISPESQVQRSQNRLERLHRVMEQLYSDRAGGLLQEEEFKTLFMRNREERAQCEEEIARYRALEHEREEGDLTQLIQRVLSFETLDRSTVTALLERVLIYEDKTIELHFRFCEPD